MKQQLYLFIALAALSRASFAAEPITRSAREFLATHCLDCHSGDDAEADIHLDINEIAWGKHHTAELWTRVFDVLRSGDMPPVDADQPSAKERKTMLAWLDETLTKHVPAGGTVLRRLNRQEYENTVRDVLGIPFSVPRSFPADTQSHGFDNIGEGLVLSPPLMDQYLKIATAATDALLPPPKKAIDVTPRTVDIGPGDFTLNFTTGHEVNGVLRMVSSSDPLARGSVWPNRFEARQRGIYEVEVDLSIFKPTQGHIPVVHLLAHAAAGQAFTKASTLRKLAEFKVENDKISTFRATIELQRGQTVVIHYENAPLSSDKIDNQAYLKRISGQLLEAFRNDPALGAAWMKAGYQRSDRGWSWWKRIQTIRSESKFDLKNFDPESEEVKAFALRMARQGVNTVETMCCMRFFTGPGINVHGMSLTGPIRLLEDEETRHQKIRTARFLGERGDRDDKTYAEAVLQPVLDKAFRRPVTDEQLARYVGIVLSHQQNGHSFESGVHLALRATLCSTHFLFREVREGPLDDYNLAARLSYFLASSPPDTRLAKLAAAGELSNPIVLEEETRRLLRHHKVKNFLASFTGQWLDLRKVPEIMPDARLLKWIDKDLQAVIAETELFVAEILQKNHPLETFIDSDFIYLNRRNAKLYGIKFPNSDTMKRVTLESGSRRGGILTQASVMMATANGVDTQPVLRGAWMLENIFGMPTPPPPTNVPAVEPDTSGASSIRELLERHKADVSCARCHQKIDPPGFILENFDPVGRWRDFYPVYAKQGDRIVTRKGQPVDAVSRLPDGTKLKDVADLKGYLVKNIDIFSRCLTGKLLTYATGRPPSFGDRKVIDQIVHDVRQQGNGFADLVVAIVQSESFRAK